MPMLMILCFYGCCGETIRTDVPPLPVAPMARPFNIVLDAKVGTTPVVYAPELSNDLKTKHLLDEMRAVLSQIVIPVSSELFITSVYIDWKSPIPAGWVMVYPHYRICVEKNPKTNEWHVTDAFPIYE